MKLSSVVILCLLLMAIGSSKSSGQQPPKPVQKPPVQKPKSQIEVVAEGNVEPNVNQDGMYIANEQIRKLVLTDYKNFDKTVRYITFHQAPNRDSTKWENTLKFLVQSFSPVILIEDAEPVKIAPYVYRINLKTACWHNFWQVVDSPYDPTANPLIVRGDWFLAELADSSESNTAFNLLYQDKVPKTRDEFLAFWQVVNTEFNFGLIEIKSEVAVNKIRWIEHREKLAGYAWGTRDVDKVLPPQDPLERPDGGFIHQGEEWIIGIPKVSAKTRQRGKLQVYLLANGQGGVVHEAPVKLVEDHSRFKGVVSIRDSGSCIQCHSIGINPFKVNGVANLIDEGVQLKVYDSKIEQFHLGDTDIEVRRNQEDYALGIALVNGCKPQENLTEFQDSIADYYSSIDIKKAAFELDVTVDELNKALSWAAVNKIEIGARLSSLVQGLEIPRTSWEVLYPATVDLIKQWRAK